MNEGQNSGTGFVVSNPMNFGFQNSHGGGNSRNPLINPQKFEDTCEKID